MYAMAIKTEPGRKTFSGAGKPKSLVPRPRQPNGQFRRETVPQIKGVVLLQPHRRGDDSQHRASAIGRLIITGQVKSVYPNGKPRYTGGELLAAASQYKQAKDGWLWGIAAKRPWTGTTPASTRMHVATYVPEEGELVETEEGRRYFASDEEEIEAADRAIAKWKAVDLVVRKCGPMVERAMQYAILYEPDESWVPPFWVVHALPAGLERLVEYYKTAA
jgi:hypothetical protein